MATGRRPTTRARRMPMRRESDDSATLVILGADIINERFADALSLKTLARTTGCTTVRLRAALKKALKKDVRGD